MLLEKVEERREFEGLWIPAIVVLDENITWFEKLLLAQINSFDSGKGCWVRHERLAEMMGCSISHVTNSICHLASSGYLQRLDLEGYKSKALRTFYSQHLKRKRDTEKSIPDTEKSTAGILRKVSSQSSPSNNSRAHAARSGDRADASFGLGSESKAEKIVFKFASFSIQHRFHLGKKGSTANGWSKDTITRWKGHINDLLNQTEFDCVENTLNWYIDHFQDEYIPQVTTIPGFCARFTDIQKAMVRTSGECHARSGPKSQITIVKDDGTEVSSDECEDFR